MHILPPFSDGSPGYPLSMPVMRLVRPRTRARVMRTCRHSNHILQMLGILVVHWKQTAGEAPHTCTHHAHLQAQQTDTATQLSRCPDTAK
jgi:hypothetical protein